MNSKYILLGVAAFGLFVGGLFYLAHLEKTSPSSTESAFIPYAEELGLDIEQFKQDLISDDVQGKVDEDLARATSMSVRSTPTFYVNGQEMDLPNDADQIKTLLEPLLENDETQDIPDGSHFKGTESPKVVIEEFSDFQCPACGSYYPTMKKVIENIGSDVALVYTNFPLKSIHFRAEAAAKAAEAAANQDKFWDMHDLLFENQSDWSS